MRLHRLLPILPAAILAAGQTLPADPFARTYQLTQQLQQLGESPINEQVQELERERVTARLQLDGSVNRRLAELRKSDAFIQWNEKYLALMGQIHEAQTAETAAMAAAAKKIYAERHADIAARPVPAIPQGRALNFDLLSFPRLDGSTSTHPLAVIVASRLLGASFEWQYPLPETTLYRARGPTQRMPYWELEGKDYEPLMEVQLAASRVNARGDTEPERRTALMINHVLAKNSNTHDAYLNLLNGACDLIFVARAPSAEEAKTARERNVEIDTVAIAKDALVFLVHPGNPVQNLTRAQLSAVFRDEVGAWSDLGGRERGITRLWREPNSGSRELFDVFDILQGAPPPPNAHQLYAISMSGPYNALATDPDAIGYTVYYYDQYMALSPHSRRLAIDGIQPTPETIASGKYPFVAPVLAAFRRSEPETSPARRLVRWLISPEGQAVVQQAGYVPAGP